MALNRRRWAPCQRNIMVRNRFAALEGQVCDSLVGESPKASTAPLDIIDAEAQEELTAEPEHVMPKSEEAVASESVCNVETAQADVEAKEQVQQVLGDGNKEAVDFNDCTLLQQPRADAPLKTRRQARRLTASPKRLTQSIPEHLTPCSAGQPERQADLTTKGSSAKEISVERPAAPEVAADHDIEACEDMGLVSKPAKKRAQKKARKNTSADMYVAEDTSNMHPDSTEQDASENLHSSMPSAKAPDCPLNGSKGPELTQKQAQALAELAVKLNEQNIANHLRAISSRRILLATPVDPLSTSGDDVLAVEPGDVLHCEVTDSLGWGFGTIVAPLRLAGKRGCFSCRSMCPVIVEVRTNRGGDTLEFTPGSWVEVAASQDRSTKIRLREKAALNRLRAARDAWDKQISR